ncbi:TPA: hypothetical protein N0F65_011330 [Lagenidium giganteum]|uniref:Uncharacterized protein n=1 Tax=Lagenidium giganteum TaxID=4803 RepID=A0AAV2YLK4_9STRA|nr:TPA: hypothetical protein N0F65_011330 [Lagenidium giganteum]
MGQRLLSDATLGLLVGIALFHVVTILFGAPVYHLVWRTFLLATLLASMTTVPAAMAFGTQQPLEWVDIVLTFRRGSSQETYVACTTIGAALGAYAGALPIPLDWDRPWQQWPLTCVYGCIGGHSFGLLLGAILIATSQRRLDGRKED